MSIFLHNIKINVRTTSAVSSVSTSGVVVTIILFSLAVIKSKLSTPLPKLAIILEFFPALIIEASIVSEIHGIKISTFSISFFKSLYEYFLSFLLLIIEKFSSSFLSIFSGSFLVMRITNFFKFFHIFLTVIISSNKVYGFKKNKYLITKYDEVNVRNGPGLNNLILFKILKKVSIINCEDFEDWFRIEDVEGRKDRFQKHSYPINCQQLLLVVQKIFINFLTSMLKF